VFEEYVEEHGLKEIGEIFSKGVKIEVGDMLPSSAYVSVSARAADLGESV
jgi:magnesium chelatase subunit I